MPGFTLWKGLKTIGVVTSRCLRDKKETIEIRYYISSLAMGVKRFARAARGHWGIENTCHWVLDVTYREDESRNPRQGAAGELCLAQSLHLVTPEAASRPRQPRHETPLLWLERKLPAGSPYRSNALVVLALAGSRYRPTDHPDTAGAQQLQHHDPLPPCFHCGPQVDPQSTR